MPEPRLQTPSSTLGTDLDSQQENDRTTPYRIMRRGSRYNILGPRGRLFTKFRSASKIGPRWEELTHTPWPYQSSAYASGQRLWELGLIDREQVGRFKIEVKPRQPATKPTPSSAGRKPKKEAAPPPVKVVVLIPPTMNALPAPHIDLAEHEKLMGALRHNPVLIFEPQMQQVLKTEVEYHRPHAKWAEHLLGLLARYEKRQRAQRRRVLAQPHSPGILAKHLAWQEKCAGTVTTV